MIEKVTCDVCDTVIEPTVVEDSGRNSTGELVVSNKYEIKNYETAVSRGKLMGSIECHICKACSKVLFRFFRKMQIDPSMYFDTGDL